MESSERNRMKSLNLQDRRKRVQDDYQRQKEEILRQHECRKKQLQEELDRIRNKRQDLETMSSSNSRSQTSSLDSITVDSTSFLDKSSLSRNHSFELSIDDSGFQDSDTRSVFSETSTICSVFTREDPTTISSDVSTVKPASDCTQADPETKPKRKSKRRSKPRKRKYRSRKKRSQHSNATDFHDRSEFSENQNFRRRYFNRNRRHSNNRRRYRYCCCVQPVYTILQPMRDWFGRLVFVPVHFYSFYNFP